MDHAREQVAGREATPSALSRGLSKLWMFLHRVHDGVHRQASSRAALPSSSHAFGRPRSVISWRQVHELRMLGGFAVLRDQVLHVPDADGAVDVVLDDHRACESVHPSRLHRTRQDYREPGRRVPVARFPAQDMSPRPEMGLITVHSHEPGISPTTSGAAVPRPAGPRNADTARQLSPSTPRASQRPAPRRFPGKRCGPRAGSSTAGVR